MGYTHYWKIEKSTSTKNWNKFSETCKKLHDNLPKEIEIVNGAGQAGTKPVFNDSEVRFNGVNELGHETFAIYKNELRDFDFCKTAQKPYDLLVCACLIAAHKYLKLDISSDGNVNDWMPAFKYYEGVMGLKMAVKSYKSFLKE